MDDKLKPKKKQPEFVTNGKLFDIKISTDRSNEWFFLSICKLGHFLPPYRRPNQKCRYLHHGHPYLKLGPFKEEKMITRPYVVIFHDILSDLEIDYLIDNSKPHLSRKRDFSKSSSQTLAKHELRTGKKKHRRIVHKTVQAWLNEANWEPIDVQNFTYVGKKYSQINHPVLWKLLTKINLATKLETKVSSRRSRRYNSFQFKKCRLKLTKLNRGRDFYLILHMSLMNFVTVLHVNYT